MIIGMDVPEPIKKVLRIFKDNNSSAFLVGDCVRDTILKRYPNRWDVITKMRVDKIERMLNTQQEVTILDIDKSFGAVKILIDGDECEISTFRSTSSGFNGKRQVKVEFVDDLKTDLLKRDFTCNSMAVDLYGNLYDFCNGYEDTKSGVLKAVGEPDKLFESDALSILRALRLATEFNMTIEPATSLAIRKNAYKLANVPKGKIKNEFITLMECIGAYKTLNEYRDVFAVFIPELRLMFDFSQNNKYHIYDVWHHALASVKIAEDNYGRCLLMKLVALFHDIGKSSVCTEDSEGVRHFCYHASVSADLTEGILRRLQFSNDEVRRIVNIIRYHDVALTANKAAIRRLIYKLGADIFEFVCQFRLCDLMAQNPQYIESRVLTLGEVNMLKQKVYLDGLTLRVTDLTVSGYDLMDLGLQGREIGVVQRKLLEEVVNDNIDNEKSVLIQYAQEFMNSSEYKEFSDNFSKISD